MCVSPANKTKPNPNPITNSQDEMRVVESQVGGTPTDHGNKWC